MSVRSARGVPYVHHFGRRDGVGLSGGRCAEPVSPDGMPPATTTAERRQAVQIDALYRQWQRNRGDLEALRALHEAIGDYLAVEVSAATRPELARSRSLWGMVRGPVRPPRWAWVAIAVGVVVIAVMLPLTLNRPMPSASPAHAEATTVAPDSDGRPRMAFLGDSYTGGSAEDSGEAARWPALLSASRSWEPLYFTVGGTGYTTAGTQDGGDRFIDRVPRIVEAAPDLVVVAGGSNDADADPDTFRDSVTEVLSGLTTQLPNAPIVVLSPFWRAAPTPPVLVERRILSEEAAAVGAAFIDVTDLFADP